MGPCGFGAGTFFSKKNHLYNGCEFFLFFSFSACLQTDCERWEKNLTISDGPDFMFLHFFFDIPYIALRMYLLSIYSAAEVASRRLCKLGGPDS